MKNEVNRTLAVKKATNNTIINSIMKKYICVILLFLCASTNVWGTGIYIDYNSTKYYDGSTITINIDLDDDIIVGTTEMTIKNDAGWTNNLYYGYGYIKASISGVPVPENIYFSEDELYSGHPSSTVPYLNQDAYGDNDPTGFYAYNSEYQYETIHFETEYIFDAADTYTTTLTIRQEELQDASTLQSATITLKYVVTQVCTPHTITLSGSPAGTLAHGSILASASSACEDATVTLTATPSTGYELNAWTVSKSEGGTCSVNGSNQFTMPDVNVTVSATFMAKVYAVEFDDEGATTAADPEDGVYTTYDSNVLSEITNPEKDGYRFAGWWSGDDGTGVEVINTSGALNANVSGFTGAGGIWIKDDDVTLHAKWTPNSHSVTITAPDNVALSATTPSISAGNSSESVDYGSTVTLSHGDPEDGHYWGGWNVYKTGDPSTTISVTDNRFTMPDYDVTVSAILFGNAKAWCVPEFEVTGDVYLTSTAGVYVNQTSATGNLIHFSGSDLDNVTKITISYLDENDEVVANTSSPLRLYGEAGSSLAEGNITSFTNGEYNQDYSIRFTVPEDTYNQIYNYKLKLDLYKSSRLLKTVTHDLYGRSLPEEFVIATKANDGFWYALPNNIVDNTHAITPVRITVDPKPLMHRTSPFIKVTDAMQREPIYMVSGLQTE